MKYQIPECSWKILEPLIELSKKNNAKVEPISYKFPNNKGFILFGNWEPEYMKYHEYFVKIKGTLVIDKNFNHFRYPKVLPNVIELYYLYINDVMASPVILPNLKKLEHLIINGERTMQSQNFLNKLEELDELILHSKQHDNFLQNLTHLNRLDTSDVVQFPNFLRNLKTLGSLNTDNVTQDPDFLKNLERLDVLYTNNAVQHPDFLRNVKRILWAFSKNVKQHPDFLKHLRDANKMQIKESKDKEFLFKIKSFNEFIDD